MPPACGTSLSARAHAADTALTRADRARQLATSSGSASASFDAGWRRAIELTGTRRASLSRGAAAETIAGVHDLHEEAARDEEAGAPLPGVDHGHRPPRYRPSICADRSSQTYTNR